MAAAPTTGLPAYRWSDDSGAWEEYKPASSSAPPPASSQSPPSAWKLVTFNVWLREYHLRERFNGLMSVISRESPDFVCLQEVTEQFLALLRTTSFVKKSYYLSDATGDTFRRSIHYGVIIMSKTPPVRGFTIVPLPSQMQRKLLSAEFLISGVRLTVATVHLESLEAAQTRAVQLSVVGEALRSAGELVLAGDLNLCANANREEDANVRRALPGAEDAWRMLRGSEAGWTEDTDTNGMLTMVLRSKNLPDVRKVRFDRVLTRSSSKSWAPCEIQVVGRERLDSGGPGCAEPVWPSDHYGLCCVMRPTAK